eukprot:SAG25_NODE_664_length_6070_cov_60.968849_8_plen_160_part_01
MMTYNGNDGGGGDALMLRCVRRLCAGRTGRRLPWGGAPDDSQASQRPLSRRQSKAVDLFVQRQMEWDEVKRARTAERVRELRSDERGYGMPRLGAGRTPAGKRAVRPSEVKRFWSRQQEAAQEAEERRLMKLDEVMYHERAGNSVYGDSLHRCAVDVNKF